MGVVHTRPSKKSTYRRTGFTAVLVPALVVAVSTVWPSILLAKQQLKSKSSNSSKPAAATKSVASAPKRSGAPAAKSTKKSLKAAPAGSKSATTSTASRSKPTKSARKTKPVSRVTKVNRSQPSKRIVSKKVNSGKAVVRVATSKGLARAAKVRGRSEDPWQQAIAMDRWDGAHAAQPKIVLPDMFGTVDEKGAEVLTAATNLLGRPYRFGARGYAFDCSGFVAEVFETVGVELPHSARSQFGIGDRITRDDLEPADLVFFHTYRRGASHVGIYIGEDKFIHAASGFGVKISSLNEGYYSARYLGARRLDM